MSYYMIPLIDSGIKLEGIEIRTVAKIVDSKLYDFENKRVGIIYSGYIEDPLNRDALAKHDELYKAYCSGHKIPEYILATGNDNEVREYTTGRILKSDYPAALGIREVTYQDANKYYKKTGNYDERAENFMNLFDNNKVDYFAPKNIISFEQAKKRIKTKKK